MAHGRQQLERDPERHRGEQQIGEDAEEVGGLHLSACGYAVVFGAQMRQREAC